MTAQSPVPERDAERAAHFIVEHVRETSGRTWKQGRRTPALACASSASALREVAEYRLRGVPDAAVHGLLVWCAGLPVELSFTVPTPLHVLALQAEGRRCVSLLRERVPGSVYAEPLAFALHDLRHLAKLAAPKHYVEQVGFFATLWRAMQTRAWTLFENELDQDWCADRDQVAADMNGSSVYLFAALKMKLKMAARRKLARAYALEAPSSGALSHAEEAVFFELQATLLDALGFSGASRTAAIATSARRDSADAATLLAGTFTEIGHAVLATRPAVLPRQEAG
jgi:hypothetical protein